MSLRQVRYFVTVARSGSFLAAARLLNVSQPSLCVQIKHLEGRLGTNLLRRHARGVELTEAGSAYLPHALAALDELERAVAGLAEPQAEEVSIGLTPTAGRALIADLLKRCKETVPKLTLLVREGLSDELSQLVAGGDLDAAFCYDPAAILKVTNFQDSQISGKMI